MKIPPSHQLHIWRSATHLSISTAVLAVIAALLVSAALAAHADLSRIFTGLFVSLLRVSAAYVVSLLLALVCGLVVTRSAKAESVLLPALDVAQSLPSFAILPAIVGIFGVGSVTIIIILVINMLWPILFAIIGGGKAVRSDLGEAAHVFGATGSKELRSFLIPALFPAMVTGSIVGWGEGWEALVGAEIIVGGSGIGKYILDVTQNGETRLFILTLVVLMFFIFLINKWVWLRLLKRSTLWTE